MSNDTDSKLLFNSRISNNRVYILFFSTINNVSIILLGSILSFHTHCVIIPNKYI